MNRPRLKASDIREGAWIISRNQPWRGVYKCVRSTKKGYRLWAKLFGSDIEEMLKTKSFRLATKEEISISVSRRIQGLEGLHGERYEIPTFPINELGNV